MCRKIGGMSATNSIPYFDQRYNDEVMLLDSLYEFHPEFFEQLDRDEKSTLQEYYGTGMPPTANVFADRAAKLAENPMLETNASQIFMKLCTMAGISLDSMSDA